MALAWGRSVVGVGAVCSWRLATLLCAKFARRRSHSICSVRLYPMRKKERAGLGTKEGEKSPKIFEWHSDRWVVFHNGKSAKPRCGIANQRSLVVGWQISEAHFP